MNIPNNNPKILAAFTRYKIIAYVTGTLLILLTISVIGKYLISPGADSIWKTLTTVLGQIHGVGFMLYFLATIDLATKLRWKPLETLFAIICGTIPTMSFFMEHKIKQQYFK